MNKIFETNTKATKNHLMGIKQCIEDMSPKDNIKVNLIPSKDKCGINIQIYKDNWIKPSVENRRQLVTTNIQILDNDLNSIIMEVKPHGVFDANINDKHIHEINETINIYRNIHKTKLIMPLPILPDIKVSEDRNEIVKIDIKRLMNKTATIPDIDIMNIYVQSMLTIIEQIDSVMNGINSKSINEIITKSM